MYGCVIKTAESDMKFSPPCDIIVDKIPLKLAKVNHADVTTKYA